MMKGGMNCAMRTASLFLLLHLPILLNSGVVSAGNAGSSLAQPLAQSDSGSSNFLNTGQNTTGLDNAGQNTTDQNATVLTPNGQNDDASSNDSDNDAEVLDYDPNSDHDLPLLIKNHQLQGQQPSQQGQDTVQQPVQSQQFDQGQDTVQQPVQSQQLYQGQQPSQQGQDTVQQPAQSQDTTQNQPFAQDNLNLGQAFHSPSTSNTGNDTGERNGTQEESYTTKDKNYFSEFMKDVSSNARELDLAIGKQTFAEKFLAYHLKKFGDRISGLSGHYVQGYKYLAKMMYSHHASLFNRTFSGTVSSENLIDNIADLGPYFLEMPNPMGSNPSNYLRSIALSKIQYLLSADFQTIDNVKRLENLAMALGYDKVKGDLDNKSTDPITISMSTELFWSFGSNIFIFGHLATLMLGYLESNAYFTSSATRPFYSWQTLISTGSEEKFSRLDAMCGVVRGSKYSRKNDGFVKPHFKRPRRKNFLKGEPRLLCSMLEVALEAVDKAIKLKGQELNSLGANVEASVSNAINSKRVQAKLCSNLSDSLINVRCDFDSSFLDHRNKGVKEAFNLLVACGQTDGYDYSVPSEYLAVISNPFDYDDVLAMTMWWDGREFEGSNSWVGDYRKLRKKIIKPISKKVDANLKYDSALAYYKQLREAKNYPNSNLPWGRLYLYMSVVTSKHSAAEWAENTLRGFSALYHMKPSLIMRGEGVKSLLEYCAKDPVAMAHIFLYHFISKKDAGIDLEKDLKKFEKGSLLSRIVHSSSLFIPNKLKKLLKMGARGFFNKKLNTLSAKRTLLRLFPKNLLHSALQAIEFVTHSLATLQISKNANMWAGMAQANKANPGGFPGQVDSLFNEWSKTGYSEYISKKINNGDQLTNEDVQKMNIKAPVSNESLNWQRYINKKISENFDTILNLPMTETPCYQKNYIYQLIKDSKAKLDENLDHTVFIGKVIPPHKSKKASKKAMSIVKSLSSMLLRTVARPVDHAVWIGVKINVPVVIRIAERLYLLQRDMPREEAWNLEGAFLDLLQDLVIMTTNPEKRSPIGLETIGENPGLPEISVRYPYMAEDERKIEFQQSQCASHCVSIWRSLLTFTLNTLNNPAPIKQFEKSLSSSSSLDDMSKPEYINSFKYILQGDSMMHMYDNMLPKKVKNEIKSLKYGKGFYFTSIVLMASSVFGGMSYPYVSRMFRIQAPYMGSFISKWQAQRKSSKIKEIANYIGLGSLASHAILNGMEVAQHARDVGFGPPETCWFHPRPPPGQKHCVVIPVKSLATSATQIAANNVFSVGLMACIGPYFIIPMAGMAAWGILKSHFKILERMQMAFTGLFSRLFTTISTKKGFVRIKKWFSNRLMLRKKIVGQAELIRTKGDKIDTNTWESPLFETLNV